MNPYLVNLVIAFAVNELFFMVAARLKTDVFTDLSYSLSFALVALALIALYWPLHPARLLPALLTLLWALRLGGYLFTRIIKIKVDHRFDGMRDRPLAFARFWILQALAVAVIMLPVSAVAAGPAEAFDALSLAGAALWLAGFVIEAAADAQKSAFKREKPDGYIRSGLWRYSRHPNYFGEALLWWGLYLYALPSLAGAAHAVVLGPVFITVLLLFVSGIPLLERSAEAKHGQDSDYRAYVAATSLFIPWPPRKDRPEKPR